MIHLILYIITVFILYIITISNYLEFFVVESNAEILNKNIDNNIQNRHPINNSLPFDKKIKYKNAYYYEYENKEYEDKLIEIFSKQKCYVNDITFNEWKNDTSITINSIYQKAYDFIYSHINNSKIIKSDDINIQIVHDVLNKYKISNDNKTTILDMSLILYRDSKDHGKHINLQIAINNNNINVFHIKVLGIVNEDKIHIYPVEHYDKLNNLYKTL